MALSVKERAQLSGGTSAGAIYTMVHDALGSRSIRGGTLVDIGCGAGHLWRALQESFDDYIGVDAHRYAEFPAAGRFTEADLDRLPIPVDDGTGDVVCAVETIEHLENPRAFFRELARIVRPNGWLLVTTPNQVSWLSLATLLFKGRFSAFQDVHYPAHVTALLPVDLRRMAAEADLRDISTEYSHEGRVILTGWHYPKALSRTFPRRCSDNLMIVGRRKA